MEQASTTNDWSFWVSILVGILFSAGLFLFFYLRKRSEPLTFIQFFVPDGGGRFLHLFGANRVMPENGDSFDIWHHRLFDLEALSFISGEKQRGNDLELNSPFVKRSVESLSRQLGCKLSLGTPAEEVDDQDNPDENDQYALRSERPPLLLVDGTETDTVNQKMLPPDCVVVTKVSSEPERFRISVRQNGRELGSHLVPGDPEYFGKVVWVSGKPWMVMTYRRIIQIRSGMALLVFNYADGKLIFNNFIGSGSRKAAQPTQQQ